MNDKNSTRPRAVIFASHSMGSTITVATLMAMRGEEICTGPLKGIDVVDRTALLSYGTQLRGYFSRFFPSVFGPGVLGVPGLIGPSLWHRDPWQAQVRAEFARDYELPMPAGNSGDELTLTTILGAEGREVPRWRSLWRRTDFLGFPVFAYRDNGNPIDRGATETAPGSYSWTIATHSGYLGTPQFLRARAELIEAFCQAQPGPAAKVDWAGFDI